MSTALTNSVSTREPEVKGKLTVKHFLHKSLPSKDLLAKGIRKYPVYVRITFQRKQADFRSQFQEIYMNRTPKPILFLPMEQLIHKNSAEESETTQLFFTDTEFDSILQETKAASVKFAMRKSLEKELLVVSDVSNLLRHHNYNIAEQGHIKSLVDQLSHPVAYAVNAYSKHLLSQHILKTKLLKNNLEVFSLINWTESFPNLYTAIESLANEDIKDELSKTFSHLVQLPLDLIRFIRKTQIEHCYQWSDAKAITSLNDYFDSQIKTEKDALACQAKVNSLKSALNFYFANLGELGGRLFPGTRK